MYHHNIRGGYQKNKSFLILTTITLAIILSALLFISYKQEQERTEELRRLAQQEREDRIERERLAEAETEALEQRKQTDSFYQKLQDGFDVNILIVGDSIGATSGASDMAHGWVGLLVSDLQSSYGISVNTTNVSMGGNASYAGYVRIMELGLASDAFRDYDLAIICYGQNDGADNFSLYYESMIRAIRAKYSKCSIISVLESSQKSYTEKMRVIMELCTHYNIPVADTIAPFTADEETYNSLTDDGVHPNDDGQRVYYETMKAVIKKHVGERFDGTVIKPMNERVVDFENFLWIGTDYSGCSNGEVSGVGFRRTDDFTYTITCDDLGLDAVAGIFGIDYQYLSGENKAVIYIDGEEFITPTVTFNYDFSQRHILIVSNDCTVNDGIKIVFETKEQADGFKGVCFSNGTGAFF